MQRYASKTPAELYPHECGRVVMYEEARVEIARLTAERDQAINALSKAAEARGRAEGKLEASELPGIVDGWKALRKKAEAERDTALAQVAAVIEQAAQAAFVRTPGKDPATIAAYVTGKSIENAIRALTPADACAILDRMLEEAYAAGQDRMRERSAVKCYEDQGRFDTPDRIRALPITPRTDRDGE